MAKKTKVVKTIKAWAVVYMSKARFKNLCGFYFYHSLATFEKKRDAVAYKLDFDDKEIKVIPCKITLTI